MNARRVLCLASALIAALLAGHAAAARPAAHRHPTTTPSTTGISYPSVAAAREDLRARVSVKITDHEGWIFMDDVGRGAVWTFTPDTHPAHPALIRRAHVQRDGHLFVELSVLCEGPKSACSGLLKDFEELNGRILESFRRPMP